MFMCSQILLWKMQKKKFKSCNRNLMKSKGKKRRKKKNREN